MNLREIRSGDFPAWLSLWEGYNAFYKRTIPPEVTKNSWDRFLNPAEPMFALVAEKEGQIVGFVHYLFHRNTAMVNDICYLQDLFTATSVRGQGVGSALIQEVYKRAKDHGASRVYWQTHETNTIAKSLYDKISDYSGFVVYRKQL